MSARRRVITEDFDPPEKPGPLAAVAEAEAARSADSVFDVLAGLDEFADQGASCKVFKLPGYQYCREIDPNDDVTAILDELRDEFGPGNYVVRVYVKGRKGQLAERGFSIASTRKREEPKKDESFSEKLLLALVTGGGMGGKGSDSNELVGAMMAAQTASADRQMTMMTTLMATITAALSGNKSESTATLLTALGPLMQQPKGAGFGEMIEHLAAARELFGGGSGGGGEDDGGVMGAVAKALAPSIPDIAAGFRDLAARGRQEAATPVQALPAMTPAGPRQVQPATVGLLAQFPLLAAIAPDVMFYFGRGLPPELAADGVFEVLAKMGVGETDLVPIVAAFSASENWVADLAAAGLDLTSNVGWANQFLENLLAIYQGEDDHREGGGRGAADAGSHGEAGALGKSANGGPQSGGGADAPS